MNCECPACRKSFPVDPNKVPPDGVFARCSNCNEVFFVQVPAEEPETFPMATDAVQPAIEEPTLGVEVEEDLAEAETPPEEPPEGLPEEGLQFLAEPDLEVDHALQFGRRDPEEKAQRLARVLVSDIILYNPDRHEEALEAGQLKEEFEDEIQKSWDEYVEQVGDETANGTPFFTEALNEILAKGQDIF